MNSRYDDLNFMEEKKVGLELYQVPNNYLVTGIFGQNFQYREITQT